jgi:hypothetical protein
MRTTSALASSRNSLNQNSTDRIVSHVEACLRRPDIGESEGE